MLHEEKTEDGLLPDEVVTEDAIDIENYDLANEPSQSLTLELDPAQNVITFYYNLHHYYVTYDVIPDSDYGTPDNSTVPTDLKAYAPKEAVDVADPLTTTQGYADKDGEKVKGTWTFVTWDKDDFDITEDTTITGGWRFEPAPAESTATLFIISYIQVL